MRFGAYCMSFSPVVQVVVCLLAFWGSPVFLTYCVSGLGVESGGRGVESGGRLFKTGCLCLVMVVLWLGGASDIED